MRKLFRLGVAAMLAASGLVVTAGASQADPVVVQDCDTPVEVDDVSFPDPLGPGDDGIPFTGDPITGDGDGDGDGDTDVCAEMRRTLVFQGVANIPNGVNFAGTGLRTAGGTYKYEGTCVLVNWEDPLNSSAPELGGCGFVGGTTNGTYQGPGAGQGNGLFNPIGAGIEEETPGYTGLDWAPDAEASCLNSDGKGISTFNAASGNADSWASTYTWNDSLNNLRGQVGQLGTENPAYDAATDSDNDFFDADGDPKYTSQYLFDAKIEAQAWPAAASPLDATAAGCLEKTAVALQDTNNYAGTGDTGLNEILIVGSASWELVAPQVLFP